MTFTIVADENIPGLDTCFQQLGTVIRVNGRAVHREHLKNADILLVRSVTRVDQKLLEGTNVRFVGSSTIGIDHLDTDYLDAQGIGWANAPGSNANSVVEYVLSAFARLDGILEKLLSGASVGIIGMGNVGGRLYQTLSALGIRCAAYDPLLSPARYPVLSDLDSVLAADVVCLHTPLTYAGRHPTFHMLGKAQLEQLGDGAVLINAGRGAAIDNAALKSCLQRRTDLSVILDVWEHEPAIDRLLMDRLALATPHIAGYSLDGKLAGTSMIYEACCRFLGYPVVSAETDTSSRQLLYLDKQGIEGLREAILASYDILNDDHLFRTVLHSAGEESVAKAFDGLRKQYPVRREFSRYRIAEADKLDCKLQSYLKSLGFELVAASSS